MNQTIAGNKKHKTHVDVLRKELVNALSECKRLNKGIKKASKMAHLHHKQYVSSKHLAELHTNQGIALRAKYEEEKEHFEAEIKKMQEKLLETDSEVVYDD